MFAKMRNLLEQTLWSDCQSFLLGVEKNLTSVFASWKQTTLTPSVALCRARPIVAQPAGNCRLWLCSKNMTTPHLQTSPTFNPAADYEARFFNHSSDINHIILDAEP